MKRIISVVLIVSTLMSLCCIGVFADSSVAHNDDDIATYATYYEITDSFKGTRNMEKDGVWGGTIVYNYSPRTKHRFLFATWWDSASVSNEFQRGNAPMPNDIRITATMRHTDPNNSANNQNIYDYADTKDGNSIGWVALNFGMPDVNPTYVYFSGRNWGPTVYDYVGTP